MAIISSIAALAGALLALLTPHVLRALPEPPDTALDSDVDGLPGPEPADAEVKVRYATLATWPFAVTVGGIAAATTALAGTLVPPSVLPVWVALSTLGVLLAAIDAKTTWLPLPLTRAAWFTTIVTLLLGGLLGNWSAALRGIGGFMLAGAVFGLVWWLTRGGLGFGDVRYAPLVGAAAAAVSWSLLAWALVLGSLVGAVVGLIRLITGRGGAFAYAPAILAGGYLALMVRWLSS